MNGKSNGYSSDREGRSPAESRLKTDVREVHPGADAGKNEYPCTVDRR